VRGRRYGTVLAGSRARRTLHTAAAVLARLHRRLKERFDPHGIFNPGRLLAGL